MVPHPLVREVLAAAGRVGAHPLFQRLQSPGDVRVFMEHHVWAVWDFMSLLKSVQGAIAPVATPWRPPADAEAARLINEIVLGEECDEGPGGRVASHFEIYLGAMEGAGADTAPIRRFLDDLASGLTWERALGRAGAPASAREFVEATMRICEGPVHGRVAALTLGREEIIPDMFRGIVRELGRRPRDEGGRTADLSGLLWYLDRHIEVDGDRHGPMTARLFESICFRDEATLTESLDIAARSLARRLGLWSGAEAAIRARRSGSTRGIEARG